MTQSETFIYSFGIYTIMVSIVWLIGAVSVLTFKFISWRAGDIYGIRRVIYAIQIVKRWEQRRTKVAAVTIEPSVPVAGPDGPINAMEKRK